MASGCSLVAGATGLVGGHVVERLLENGANRVVVLVRKKTDTLPAEVEQKVVDYDALDPAIFAGVDDVYLCLGTTIKKAGSEDAFRKVDHDYTLAVASTAKAAGAKRCALVSAIGASPKAPSFYYRVKGETDRDVEALGFDDLVIARPSFLVGDRQENRPGERVGIAVTKALGFALVGGWSKYRVVEAKNVARALVAALPDAGKLRILEHDAIVELSR
jgi:uncharacterized protein YbjT (DUF2867 family)